MISPKVQSSIEVLVKVTNSCHDADSLWELFIEHNEMIVDSLQTIVDANAIDLLNTAHFGLFMATDDEETETHVGNSFGLYSEIITRTIEEFDFDVIAYFEAKHSEQKQNGENVYFLENCLSL